MFTRRGLAVCAICAAAGFIATGASGQNAAPKGIRTKMLSRVDGPVPGYATLIMEVEIDPNTLIPRHTHPGIETTYVLEGGFDFSMEGKPNRPVKAGDGFQVPTGIPHAGVKTGKEKTKLVITYVVEKDKPLMSLVPA